MLLSIMPMDVLAAGTEQGQHDPFMIMECTTVPDDQSPERFLKDSFKILYDSDDSKQSNDADNPNDPDKMVKFKTQTFTREMEDSLKNHKNKKEKAQEAFKEAETETEAGEKILYYGFDEESRELTYVLILPSVKVTKKGTEKITYQINDGEGLYTVKKAVLFYARKKVQQEKETQGAESEAAQTGNKENETSINTTETDSETGKTTENAATSQNGTLAEADTAAESDTAAETYTTA